MAYCKKCGKQLADDAAFCSACGTPACQTKKRKSSGRQERYDGVIHKCPNCGERLESFVSECPACGFELRDIGSCSQVNDLSSKLELAKSASQRNELIRNFYIPNTKEDIYEFVILATSNIEAGGESVDAWYAKLDQALKKAYLVFGEGEELARIKRMCDGVSRKRATGSIVAAVKRSRGVQCLLLFLFGLILEFIGNYMGSQSGDPNSSFYMLGMFGTLPIIGAMALFIVSYTPRDA